MRRIFVRKHALIVGGAGMLLIVPRWLVNEDYHISVFDRDLQRKGELMGHLKDEAMITPLNVD